MTYTICKSDAGNWIVYFWRDGHIESAVAVDAIRRGWECDLPIYGVVKDELKERGLLAM